MKTASFENVIYEHGCGLSVSYDFTATRSEGWTPRHDCERDDGWNVSVTEIRDGSGNSIVGESVYLRGFATTETRSLVDLLREHAEDHVTDYEAENGV
jgi:hypothetical protein